MAATLSPTLNPVTPLPSLEMVPHGSWDPVSGSLASPKPFIDVNGWFHPTVEIDRSLPRSFTIPISILQVKSQVNRS